MFEELLLIESDQEILDAFKKFLERHRYTVATAASGEEAILQLKLRRPNLIVIEPILADDWSERVLRQYRHSAPGVPVIGLSKRTSCSVAFPFSIYFVKPISLVALLDGIQNLLQKVSW
jgi:two-component system, OmpR family, response regulator